MNEITNPTNRLGVDVNLLKFLADVKLMNTMGFYGANLEAHLLSESNDGTIRTIFELRRADLANA